MSSASEAARGALRICAACNYCDGFCPVFRSLAELRRGDDADLHHLAHLCHDCRACLHACQYAPPHPFAVDVPQALAALRTASYRACIWPAALAGAAGPRHGHIVAAVLAAAAALCVAIALAVASPGPRGTAPFQDVVPLALFAGLAAAAFAWALLGIAMATRRYWRLIRGSVTWRDALARAPAALVDGLLLRHQSGGGAGCHERAPTPSHRRRRLHRAMVAGLAACALAAASGAVAHHGLGLRAPYPWTSVPVIAGALGGALLVVAAIGLLVVERVAPGPGPRRLETALIATLGLVGASGLAVLALRDGAALAPLLALHIGLVIGLFVTAPFGKLLHAPFRLAALVRGAAVARPAERRAARGTGVAAPPDARAAQTAPCDST